MKSKDNIRPLVLWSLVSSRIYEEHAGGDFYLSLTPFFEPFVLEHNGEMLDVEELCNYAAETLRLPLSSDIAELLIDRMVELGWLKIEGRDTNKRVYLCAIPDAGVQASDQYSDLESKLDEVLIQFRQFLADNLVDVQIENSRSLEEDFLLFLNRAYFSTQKNSSLRESDPFREAETNKLEYWVAKYIAWLNLNDQSKFEVIEKIAGVALLADALLEVRAPSLKQDRPADLAVILDGPFLMEYMGLSGNRFKENAAYVVDKLRAAGASIACFRHSCDEIRDNLFGLLERQPFDRVGPSAEALRQKEISEVFLTNVRNNVEHFVKTLANVTILNQRPEQLKHAIKHCDDRIHYQLAAKMPSQSEIGRERDADSITIVMRRRQGHETTELLNTKVLFLTSNEQLVRRANEFLRTSGVLNHEKSIIGPALHHRVVSGLLFANFGQSDKREVSRRQLLVACVKVVMLRPRIVEKVRAQVLAMNEPQDMAVIDALLSQPRATEVLMDFTIGGARSISSSNIGEAIRLIKKTAADEITKEYETKLLAERQAAAKELARQREETTQILKSEREQREADTDNLQTKLTELEEIVSNLSGAQIASENALKGVRQRNDESAVRIATLSFKKTLLIQRTTKYVVTVGLSVLFLFPAIYVTSPYAPLASAVVAIISVGALNGYLWNTQSKFFSNFFSKYAIAHALSDLRRLGMVEEAKRLKLNYLENLIEIEP